MNWLLYQSELIKNLNSLPFIEKVKFGVNICENLYPDYVQFQEKNNWGDHNVLDYGIKLCKNFIKFQKNNRELFIQTIKQLDKIIPDTDDFGDIDGTLALNASTSVYETIFFLISQSDENILNVANNMYHSIETKLLQENPDLSENEIGNHKSLQDEIKSRLTITNNS